MRIGSRILSLLCFVLLTTSSAHADFDQAPRTPQAIRISELKRYDTVLGLSQEQRLAVEAEYERYLDDFEPLRAEMMELSVSMPRNSRGAEDFTQHLPGFVARARDLDAALFAGIEPLLTDWQKQNLQRVRDLRERTMLVRIDALWRFIGDGIPDLRELLESLQPDPGILAPLASAVDEYEARLTKSIRAAFDQAVRLCTDDDPRVVEQFVENIRSLRALNRKCFEDSAANLPDDLRRRWRSEFLLYGYGGIEDNVMVWGRLQIELALSMNPPDSERQPLEQLRREITQLQDAAIAKLMDAYDRSAILTDPKTGVPPEPDLFPALNAVRQEMQQRANEIRKQLRELLGKDRLDSLKPKYDQTRGASISTRRRCGIMAITPWLFDRSQMQSVPGGSAEPLMAQPLSEQDINDFTAALRLDDARRDTVLEQFRPYAERMKNEMNEPGEVIFRNSPGVFIPMREGEDPLERARAAEAARLKILSAIKAADAELLEAIRTIASVEPDDAIWQRLLRMRERALITVNCTLRPVTDPNRSGEIDLMRLLLPRQIDEAGWKAIDELTASYESELLARLNALYEPYVQYWFENIGRRHGWKPEGESDAQDSIKKGETLHQAHRGIAELNGETLQKLAAALPAEIGAAIVDEYNRKVFPKAFVDPVNMESILVRAAGLQEVNAQQRERIGEIRVQFLAAYEQIRRQMIAACAASFPDMPMIGFTITAERAGRDERFRAEFQRLTDERSQINRRALHDLRLALTPAQLRKLEIPEIE